MKRLNDTQVLILQILVVILVPIGNWASIGFPTGRNDIGYVVSAIIVAFVVWAIQRLKEETGGSNSGGGS